MAIRERVLLLNRVWQPLTTIPMKKALKLVFRDRAKVIDPETYQLYTWDEWIEAKALPSDAHVEEGDYIKTTSMYIMMPLIVTLSKFAGYPNRGIPFSRKRLYERDRYTCQYTGERLNSRDITIDHVIPVSKGGTTCWENCVVASFAANQKKGNRTPQEAGMPLLSVPREPTQRDLIRRTANIHPAWEPFLKD